MADKGFRTEDQLAEIELRLNISLFADSAQSMNAAYVTITRKEKLQLIGCMLREQYTK